jgi:hypothetical protein
VSAESSSTSIDTRAQLDSVLGGIATHRRLAACAPGLPVRLPRARSNSDASRSLGMR